VKIFNENHKPTFLVDKIMEQAVILCASDIHFDISRENISIRFRIDGIMEQIDTLPRTIYPELFSRLKILSGLRTDVHSDPQDGRYQTNILGKVFNVRTSFMPTYYGESAVLRLLPLREDDSLTIYDLGFCQDHIDSILQNLNKTSGIILITGPTGSGKTTTLNVCLKIKAKEPISIISLEDPIEYEVKGIRQVAVRQNFGFTFAKALRSCLRQDPDIIMVGEIRDRETAEIAIHTALTGHLVLSTLHAGRASEVLERLFGMGIERYLILETVNLIIAQRLVRKVCIECKMKEYDRCNNCRKSGYKGRMIISEIIDLSRIRSMKGDSHIHLEDIESYIHRVDFLSIDRDGQNKVDQGCTTYLEIKRVI
jgi:type IV pilus assembly protein PilB